MKRSALMMAVAVCLLIFSGCGGTVDITPIREAVANAPEQAHGSFTANIRFGDELATLLFSMGSFDADYEKNTLSAEMTRTVLASAAKVELEYDGTTCTTIIDGEEHTGEMSPEALFGSLLYARPAVPDEGSKISASLSADGLYTVKCKNPDSNALFSLLGDDIYSIAYINVPRKDKMYCEDAVFTYRIKDGAISDYSLAFTAHLFDTPPYVPGKDVDESGYELDLFVEFNVSYRY